MSGITSIIFLLVGLFAFAIFAVIAVFVVVGALKLFKANKELATVNVFDGLDSNELRIIADALLKKKQSDEEVRVKADAVEALKIK
jgi:hypothetical protein